MANQKPEIKLFLTSSPFVNIGERAGSGYPLIINAAKDGNYPTPEVYDKFNPDVTKLTIFIKKLASHDENLGNDVKNLPVLPENLPIDIINNSIHKNDVKIKLTKIYVELKDEVISRNVISNLLSVSDKTSYNLILYLLDLGLIVPILGHGKGKYKFK